MLNIDKTSAPVVLDSRPDYSNDEIVTEDNVTTCQEACLDGATSTPINLPIGHNASLAATTLAAASPLAAISPADTKTTIRFVRRLKMFSSLSSVKTAMA